jgi:hypothetical protein
MRIEKHISSGGANGDDHVDGELVMAMEMIKVLGHGKEEREK